MIWFLLFQILGLVVLLLLIYGYCRIRKKAFWRLIWHKLKWVVLAELVVLVIISLFCWNALYNTAHCYFRGVSMKTETKYSWYLGECQIKTPSGTYVPVLMSESMEQAAPITEADKTDE